MLQTTFYSIFFAITVILHQLVFFFFIFSLVRIVFYKITPYASLCVAIISAIQVVFDGCPLTFVNNYFLLKAGFTNIDENSFWGGIFGQYTEYARILFLFLSLVMFYYSYKTWSKVEVGVNLRRIFQKYNPQVSA